MKYTLFFTFSLLIKYACNAQSIFATGDTIHFSEIMTEWSHLRIDSTRGCHTVLYQSKGLKIECDTFKRVWSIFLDKGKIYFQRRKYLQAPENIHYSLKGTKYHSGIEKIIDGKLVEYTDPNLFHAYKKNKKIYYNPLNGKNFTMYFAPKLPMLNAILIRNRKFHVADDACPFWTNCQVDYKYYATIEYLRDSLVNYKDKKINSYFFIFIANPQDSIDQYYRFKSHLLVEKESLLPIYEHAVRSDYMIVDDKTKYVGFKEEEFFLE